MTIVQNLDNTEETDSVPLQLITLERVDGVPMSVHQVDKYINIVRFTKIPGKLALQLESYICFNTMFSVPNINCEVTFKGGCKNWQNILIKEYDTHPHTVQECYALCSKTDYCNMFEISHGSRSCVLFKMGCKRESNKHDHYSMQTCSGIKYILKFKIET